MSKNTKPDLDVDGFDLDASEEELLDEFGLLMAAEYYYAVGKGVAAVVERPSDPLTAFIKYSLPGVALRVSRSRLEERLQEAVKAEPQLFRGG